MQLPKIMLVDMNSFFASVEQQANPFLRGKPLGVCASLHRASCLIATSKEAKARGIKNGMPLYAAKRIIPEIMVVEAEPEKYREVHRQINRIFDDYSHTVEPYSVDESFLDLHASRQSPLVVGAEIKRRIREEIGEWLTCSVGIAPNKFMAKLAADLQKPDGLTVIWRENLREVYKSHKLSDLWGIGRGWTKRLERLGVKTPTQLMDYPPANLMQMFGKPGLYLWQRVNGLEEDGIVSPDDDISPQKSFGNSWVLDFRSSDKERLKPAVLRLAEKAARRMRHEGYVASSIYCSVRFSDYTYFHRSIRLGFEVETGMELYGQVLSLWEREEFRSEAVHIAVGFTGLRQKRNQMSLWPEEDKRLTAALDAVNDRYGEFTVMPGLLAHTAFFAPDSIAFGK